MSITAALDILAGQVQAVFPAVRVTRDPADLLPPCFYVAAPTAVGTTLAGALRMEVPVYAVATAPGDRAGMDPLLDALPALMRVCGAHEAAPVSLQPSESLTYPAYRVTARVTASIAAAVEEDAA